MVLKSKTADAKTDKTNTVETDKTNTVETDKTNTVETEEKAVTVSEPAGAPAAPPSGQASAFCTAPGVLEAVAGAKYGTFTSIVAVNGQHQVAGKEVTLGPEVKFQAIIEKSVWKVTPGSEDAESKDYFKVSHDGEICTDGESVEDAILTAKEAGYADANVKEYVDVICHIVDCKNPDFIGETVTMQLAPSSQFSWRPLAAKCKMGAVLGTLRAEPFGGNPDLGQVVVITSTATGAVSTNKKNYTKFEYTL